MFEDKHRASRFEKSTAFIRCTRILLIWSLLLQAPSTVQAAVEDSWNSVRKIPQGADFVFIDRSFVCRIGQVRSSNESNLTLRAGSSDVILEKANILRVQRRKPSADIFAPLSVLYSGRSSWVDIEDFMPFISTAPSYEVRLEVVTLHGKKLRGALKVADETTLVLRDQFSKETQIPRAEVATVDYIRLKPLSDKQEFYQQELGLGVIFDAVLYPRLFHVADTMLVRLYDRSAHQDDSQLKCQ